MAATGDGLARVRTARQRWAAPGSRHDRLITLLNSGLPIAIGVLAAFLVMAPLTASNEVSFVLDKNKVEVAKERMKLQAATYRGQDDKGQAFTLNAGSAVQQSSSVPIVQINRMAADLQLQDGPATLRADQGRYDLKTEQMKVDGPIAVRGPNNYRLDTSDATIDLKSKTMQSDGKVTGTVTQGNFSADRLNANLDDRTVRLTGNARLRIVPGRTK
ncbi:LPS export ABC transporter periplasmic protein LptC [Arthrobacter sp. TPD3018]|nr:LPS export ABC transporter periplasmic protein LptC [Sphingomonas sp. TPD3009]PVE52548.1 LPS export ABC transporter periplasmic protein LptC [Arthrobacter sp. TPD3018]PVE80675.1 LPS export ABC transporter periplasmic protein LptC [Sphingomonas melonis]RTL14189.1 MAG: LPS export ABC transporter periplasmic protein LptC [Sphingomonadaceae bacterium]